MEEKINRTGCNKPGFHTPTMSGTATGYASNKSSLSMILDISQCTWFPGSPPHKPQAMHLTFPQVCMISNILKVYFKSGFTYLLHDTYLT